MASPSDPRGGRSRRVSRRRFLAGSAVLGAALATPASAAPAAGLSERPKPAAFIRRQARELVITSFGGSFERAVKSAYVEPFQREFNATVVVETAISTETLAKLRAQKGSPQVDVAFMDIVPMTLALNDDLIDTLDTGRVTDFDKLYPVARDPQARWAGSLLASTGLVYNTSVFKTPPTSWLDLWNPEWAGKIALPDIAQTAGYQFLVAIARLQGGSETNADPAFAKIAELKSNVLAFFRVPDQIVALLNQGDVVLAPWYNDRTYAARDGGAPIDYTNPQEGGMLIVSCMGVAKGSKNKQLAEDFINFAISREHQTEFSTMMREGPTNREVQLSADVAKLVPYGEESVGKLYAMDVNAVAAALPTWTDRWAREITS